MCRENKGEEKKNYRHYFAILFTSLNDNIRTYYVYVGWCYVCVCVYGLGIYFGDSLVGYISLNFFFLFMSQLSSCGVCCWPPLWKHDEIFCPLCVPLCGLFHCWCVCVLVFLWQFHFDPATNFYEVSQFSIVGRKIWQNFFTYPVVCGGAGSELCTEIYKVLWLRCSTLCRFIEHFMCWQSVALSTVLVIKIMKINIIKGRCSSARVSCGISCGTNARCSTQLPYPAFAPQPIHANLYQPLLFNTLDKFWLSSSGKIS